MGQSKTSPFTNGLLPVLRTVLVAIPEQIHRDMPRGDPLLTIIFGEGMVLLLEHDYIPKGLSYLLGSSGWLVRT